MAASRILWALPAAPLRLAAASRLAVAIPGARRSYSPATTTTTTTPIANAAAPSPPPQAPATTPSKTGATQDAPAMRHANYFVARSPSNNLPIYEDAKKGGTTLLRKIEGNAHALKVDLMRLLEMDGKMVTVNPRTNHISIKGHVKSRLRPVLEKMGF